MSSVSRFEEDNRSRRVLRTIGYDDGYAGRDKNPKYLREPEYLRAYRRGVERRLQIESGAVDPDA